MYHYMSPGALGSHNGGLDFNDIVNPAARTFVEGLFGIRPDLPNRVIEIAPQLSPDWDHASLTTNYVKVAASGFRQSTGSGTVSVAVELRGGWLQAGSGSMLKVRLPLRAAQLANVTANGEQCSQSPPGCTFSVDPGFGQTVVTVLTTVPDTSALTVSVDYEDALGYIRAVKLQGVSGGAIKLDVGKGSSVEHIDNPQGSLASHTTVADGVVSGVLSNNSGFSLVSVTVRLGDATTQRRLFKLNVTNPVSIAAHAANTVVSAQEVNNSLFTPINISGVLHFNLSNIFHPPGGYLQPRPATCASRIATDGYSPWSFKNAAASQGDMPPYPDFSNVSADGLVVTSAGARFRLQHKLAGNVGFVSMWHNYPTSLTVPLSNIQAQDVVWLLISGSTNNMQTRLANAVIQFTYTDGTAKELELVPPLNYWSLTPIAGIDYDYVRDGFCLPAEPPPTVQLGQHNRAMVYSWRATSALASVTLEALSLEVVLGLLAVSVSRPSTPPAGSKPVVAKGVLES